MSLVVTPQVDHLAKLNKFFLNEAGRDKFNKIIQYGSRLLAYHLLSADPKSEWGKSFSALFALTRDCRKIVRLLKFLAEYEKIRNLLQKQPTTQKQFVQLVGAAGLAAYWWFDNLVFLSKGKMLTANPEWAKYSMQGWWVGILCGAIIDIQSLHESYKSESELRSQLRLDGSVTPEDSSKKAKLNELLSARTTLYLNCVKNAGDFLISSNGWDLPKTLLGQNFNDGVVGLAGVISGTAVCTTVWRGIK